MRPLSLGAHGLAADEDRFGLRRLGLPRLVTIASVPAFGLALVAARSDVRVTQWVSNVGLVIAAVFAAAACWWHAGRAPAGSRRAWGLIGLGCLSWGIGQMIWTGYESFFHREVPFPSAADAGYLATVPLVAAGLLAFPNTRVSIAGLLRVLLDGLATACSLLVVSWWLILSPIFHGDSDLGSKLILLAYPAGDVVVITIVLTAISRTRKGAEMQLFSLQLLCVGLLAFAVSDSGFAYMTVSSSYTSGNVIDLGWFAGFAIVAVAGLGRNDLVTVTAEDVPVSRTALLLPYIPVLIAATTLAIEAVRGGVDGVLAGATAVLLVLLMLRQVLTLLENVSLTRNLEARVLRRTTDLLRSEERFRSLVQNSSDVVVILDRLGTISYVSPSAENVFGFRHGLTDTSFLDLIDSADRQEVVELLQACALVPGHTTRAELAVIHSDGSRCQTEATVTNLLDDEPVGGLVLNMRDVTDRKVLEHELRQLAFSDSLTCLANRARFTERLAAALEHGRSNGRHVAVLFMDLDGFKEINDSLGHAAGDELLVAVAERLRWAVRSADLVARLGGDEFGILLEDLSGAPEAMAA
ncbi:MAG: Diguanylate cyclase, partial [Acidimicrobiia bacterium]|nr:Diguanylate cyclase [Acidimicrobiia bacterium]